MTKNRFTIIITKGQVAYVAYCQELGIASQGKSISMARKNIKEAVLLYLEEAKDSLVASRKLPIISTMNVGR